MIKNFEDYNNLNEGTLNKAATLALNIALIFNSIKGDNPKRYDMNYFQNYAKTLNIANDNYVYKRVLEEAKRKVSNDPWINNKNEIIKKLDSVIVFYKKNDEFCNNLFRSIDREISNTQTMAAIINHNIMILDPLANADNMYHELMHVVYDMSNNKENFVKLYNFTNSPEKQEYIIRKITGNDWNIPAIKDTSYIKYLSEPTEIYARLNQLKFYLFKNKFIKTPYDKLSNKVIYDLISGEIYSKLNEKEKEVFIYCGFIDLLKFIDASKIEQFNKY